MYQLSRYLEMMTDPVRIGAYERALRAVVRPGDVVVDLGAGAGLLGLLALEAGASRVYAVEFADVVLLGREAAERSGHAERITFLQGHSAMVDLPERVDLLLADLRGVLPLLGDSVTTFMDARDRFLKPGGRMIPFAEALVGAPVECASGFAAVSGWREPIAGLDYSHVADLAANLWTKQPFTSRDLLAPGQVLVAIDYATLESDRTRSRTRFTVERAGRCNGIGVWFRSELAPGVVIDTGPESPPTVYVRAYFPLSHEYAVEPGDTVDLDFQTRVVDKIDVWIWAVRIEREGQPPVEERHSDFEGVPLDVERLRRLAPGYAPALADEGRVTQYVLEAMDGRATLEEIAETVARRMPERFATGDAALAAVREVSRRYGR